MSRIRGRVGKGGNLGAISSMDAFNYNMLGILKTKEERLGMMERMSMIQESLPASMTAPEPELQIGTFSTTESAWVKQTDKINTDRKKSTRWISRFSEKIDSMPVVDTGTSVSICLFV